MRLQLYILQTLLISW